MEKIFEEISKELDGGLPSGGDWHQKLLVQMASEIPTRRPAVIRRATRDCLEGYRRFRHTVLNIYTFNLRPARLQDLTSELRSCYRGLCEDTDIFCQFLLALSNASDSPR